MVPMSESTPPEGGWVPPPTPSYPPPPTTPYPSYGGSSYGGQSSYVPAPGTPYGSPTYPYGHLGDGSVGKIRSTGACILLTIVTFGFYPLYWWYAVHTEMKRHSGQGIGGGVALLLAFFIGFVTPFITSSEVGDLYERAGSRPPVSGLTGLWYVPGFLILIGPLIWFVKTNGALNSYWRTRG